MSFSSWIDNAQKLLYDEVLARDETHMDIFTMKKAWDIMTECAEERRIVKKCVLEIIPEDDGRFTIFLTMLDKDGKHIKRGNAPLGRKVTADGLDDTVTDFMAGDLMKVMEMPY